MSLAVRVGKAAAARTKAYIWPKKKDPNPLKVDPCNGRPIPPEEQQ